MSRILSRRPDYQDECCCALNPPGSGSFRRTSSLRLRGEKMVQRSPLAARKYFPVITENSSQKHQNGAHFMEPNHRPRSHSLSSNAIEKLSKTGVKSNSRTQIEQSMSTRDSATTPPGSPEDLLDNDSLNSYGSASVDASFAPFNGTTFSGRSMRYVLHCSAHAGQGEEYLTPTQRAQRQIRRLKSLLTQAKRDLDKKDSEIFHLTKEVVELRLYKASLISPDDKSNSSEIVTIRENADEQSITEEGSPKHEVCEASFDVADGAMFKDTPTRSRNSEMQGSFTDSGHFDDLANISLHSKESIHVQTHDASCMTDFYSPQQEKEKLIEYYEKKIEDVIRAHVGESQEVKKEHNDKVEALLQKLADVNNHYCELLPNYEQAKERIHALERQLEDAMKLLKEEESKHSSMYLQMYTKGLQAAKLDTEKQEGDVSDGPSSRVSVEELLQQLQITQTELENVRDTAYTTERSAKALLSAKEAVSLWVLGARKAMYRRIVESQKGKNSMDPEITLQFLKSAIFYFLTDPENHQGHLSAIENILGFTEAEKEKIRKARMY